MPAPAFFPKQPIRLSKSNNESNSRSEHRSNKDGGICHVEDCADDERADYGKDNSFEGFASSPLHDQFIPQSVDLLR